MAFDTTLLEALIAATPTPGGYWNKDTLQEIKDNLDAAYAAGGSVTVDGTTITGDGTVSAALTVIFPLPAPANPGDNSKILTASGGSASWQTAPSGLPAVGNEGDVLTVVSGVWTAAVPVPGEKGDTGDTGATGGFNSIQAINPITAAYTLQLADAGALIKATAAAVVTVPPSSSEAFEVGHHIDLMRYTSGAVSIAAGSGVTIRAPYGTVLKTQYAAATLVKLATDEWLLVGDLEV